MRYSLVAAIAAVLAMAGCRYGEDAANAADTATDALAVNGENIDSDFGNLSVTDELGGDGSIVPPTEVSFDKLYQRVTDVSFEPVYFGFDANSLQPGELAKIEAVADHLRERTDRVVIVEGNCDDRGSNEYNLVLGEQRAISIRDYLVTLGIAGDRIQQKSYGEEKPAVPGSGEEVWAKNRRGEFAIYQR